MGELPIPARTEVREITGLKKIKKGRRCIRTNSGGTFFPLSSIAQLEYRQQNYEHDIKGLTEIIKYHNSQVKKWETDTKKLQKN